MLPVRLGMANSNGPQELFVYAVTRTGRVEPVNYRSLKLPETVEAPPFVKGDFSPVWRAAFDRMVDMNGMGVVYTEYAWDMTWCDPCPSPPLDRDEQKALGVWWLDEPNPTVFVTRLHARYDRESFPEDLVLQVTSDRTNFQSRVVVRHEWTGEARCEAAMRSRESLWGCAFPGRHAPAHHWRPAYPLGARSWGTGSKARHKARSAASAICSPWR